MIAIKDRGCVNPTDLGMRISARRFLVVSRQVPWWLKVMKPLPVRAPQPNDRAARPFPGRFAKNILNESLIIRSARFGINSKTLEPNGLQPTLKNHTKIQAIFSK